MGAQAYAKSPVGSSGYARFSTIATGAVATEAFVCDRIVGTVITGSAVQGNVQIEFDSKVNNEEFNTFLNTYLSATPVEPTTQPYENGDFSTISAGGEAATQLALEYYEAPINGKTCVHTYTGYLGGNTGSKTFSNGTLSQTPITFIGRAYQDSDVVFADTVFNTALVTGVTVTVASNSVGAQTYMTSA